MDNMDNQYGTLSEATEAMNKKGYTLDFNLAEDKIECKSDKLEYKAHEFQIDEFHRFEGPSNPDDMSILYAITTNDGKKGTLIDAYGAYSDPLSTEMIQKMRLTDWREP